MWQCRGVQERSGVWKCRECRGVQERTVGCRNAGKCRGVQGSASERAGECGSAGARRGVQGTVKCSGVWKCRGVQVSARECREGWEEIEAKRVIRVEGMECVERG